MPNSTYCIPSLFEGLRSHKFIVLETTVVTSLFFFSIISSFYSLSYVNQVFLPSQISHCIKELYTNSPPQSKIRSQQKHLTADHPLTCYTFIIELNLYHKEGLRAPNTQIHFLFGVNSPFYPPHTLLRARLPRKGQAFSQKKSEDLFLFSQKPDL